MTNQCTRCTYELEDGAVVCIHCGAALGEPAGPDAARSSVASDLSDPPVATREATPATPAQPVIASPMFSTGSDLNGIGGWLILVAIGLAISPFIMMHGVYTDLRILTGDRYQAGLALRPGLAGLVMFEAITNTLFLAAVVCLNVLL